MGRHGVQCWPRSYKQGQVLVECLNSPPEATGVTGIKEMETLRTESAGLSAAGAPRDTYNVLGAVTVDRVGSFD